MAFDLTTLSPKDLDALISTAKQRKVALKKRKPIAAVREKLARAASAEGYSLDELFAGAAASAPAGKRASKKRAAKRAKKSADDAPAVAKAKRGRPAGKKAAAGKTAKKAAGKVAPKYRNPANESEVWSGRGMTPRWMAAYISQGKSKDDFLI